MFAFIHDTYKLLYALFYLYWQDLCSHTPRPPVIYLVVHPYIRSEDIYQAPTTFHVLSSIIAIYSLDAVQTMRDIQLLWRRRMLNGSIVLFCGLNGITEITEEIFPHIWVPKLVAKWQTSWIYVVLCVCESSWENCLQSSLVSLHHQLAGIVGDRDDDSLIFFFF